MKFIKENITTILWVAVGVLLYAQIEGCSHNSKPNSEYKKEIADKDKQIEAAKAETNIQRGKYDSVIALLTQKDTVLIREYKTNTIKYEKVANNINSLGDAELARAVEQYR